MLLEAHVEDGKIVLDEPAELVEGSKVQVTVPGPAPGVAAGELSTTELPTVFERFKSVFGIADGLPPDASLNVDHYLYGAPKR